MTAVPLPLSSPPSDACASVMGARGLFFVNVLTRRSRMFPFLDDAACRGLDPELFYAEGAAAVAHAKSLCNTCPVQMACLEWAVRREEFGVWGGTTARERSMMRRERGLQLVPAGVGCA